MTLRNRFTLISSLTFGVFSVVTSLIIFYTFYDSSRNFYFNALQNVALTSAIYYLEKDELPTTRHAHIKAEYRNVIQNTNVAVYNQDNQVAFGKNLKDRNIHTQQLNTVRKNKRTQFMSKDYFYYGIYYKDNQGNFVVFVRSSNAAFQSQIFQLSVIILSVLLIGFVGIYLLSRYLSGIVYKPVSEVANRINLADYNDISKAITTTNTNDEINDLINAYNKLLGRISESVMVQQNFINYVSHEFKTPLAAISGNLEVFAQKDRSPEEYKKVTGDVLNHVFEIERILNNLLLMSGLKKLEESHQLFRLDELIFKICHSFEGPGKAIPAFDIRILIDDHHKLEFCGNETLLHLAIYNIIENAVKYSEGKEEVTITILEEGSQLCLTVSDHGKGIPVQDLPKITGTFYRAANVGDTKGSGIGLSLSKAIFDHHHITMSVQSREDFGTTVALRFP